MGFSMGRAEVPFPERVTDGMGRSWRVAQLRVGPTAARVPGALRPRDNPLEGKSYHEEVVLAAFASLDETEATLANLAWFLVSISTMVWMMAAICARWLSRKTLVPLTRLVESARSLDVTNPGWILAEVGTRDELDDLRRAFNDLLSRLREAYDRQRRFSSQASHQLRTPVAIMLGHLEVAQRYERSGEDYRRVIEIAHKRAIELGQIVESLLFLNRPDSATLTRAETFDLSRWLVEHMASRAGNLRSSDIVVESRYQFFLCGSKPSRNCSVNWSRTCWTMPASTAVPGRPSWSRREGKADPPCSRSRTRGAGSHARTCPGSSSRSFARHRTRARGCLATGSACQS